MKRTSTLAALTALTSIAGAARAQTVTWEGPPVQYDRGSQPVAAINGPFVDDVVEEHQAGNEELWLNTGGWGWSQIGGGNTFGLNDFGTWQSIAGDSSSDSSLFVSVFTYTDGQTLIYRTGTLNSASFGLHWDRRGPFSIGVSPSVAQATAPNGTTQFIVLYQGAGACRFPNTCPQTGNLYYQTGTLNADGMTISWNGVQGLSGGSTPAVSIAPIPGTNQFFVVDVHQASGDYGPLWADFGVLDAGASSVHWTQTVEYNSFGLSPSVAICSEAGTGSASVIEVHNGDSWAAGLYQTGRIEPLNGYAEGTVSFGPQIPYAVGKQVMQPSVACNGYFGVEVHEDDNGVVSSDNTLSYGLLETRFTIN